MKYNIFKEISLTKYELFIFAIILISSYFLYFGNSSLELFYRQYDIFGNFVSINKNETFILIKLIKIIFNSNNEILIYKQFCFVVFCINLFSLFYFLSLFKLDNLDKFIIILIFSFFPNFYLRMNYGHASLIQYYYFFFSLAFVEHSIINNRNKIYLLSIFILILLCFLNDIQYGIYCVLLSTIYLIYRLGFKKIFQIIRFKFYTISFSLTLILIIIILTKYDQIIEFREYGRLFFDINYVNKYSLINPLEFFINSNFIYENLEFIFNDYIKNQIKEFETYLLFYSPNGPEFTFYYGPTILLSIFFTYYSDKRLFLAIIISTTLIILFTINTFFFFSLLEIQNFFLPFIRSVQRSYIIFDILIILSLIRVFQNYKDKKWSYLKIIFGITTIIFLLQKDHKGTKYDINDFLLNKESNYSLNFLNLKEHYYLYEFLELKNNVKLSFSNNKNIQIYLNYDSEFYSKNNPIIIKNN